MSTKNKITPFGKLVKIRLIEKEMSQVELAKELKTTKQYLYDILHGRKSGEKHIYKICNVLDINVNEIK